MWLPRLPSRKTVTAEDINDVLDKIEKMFRGLAGAGITFRETPAGLVLSASPRFPIIIQDTEPLPGAWPQGWLWINTSTLYGNNYHVYIKTAHSAVNNNSKVSIALYL